MFQLDKILPPEYSEIVFTGNNNDPPHLKKWHLDQKRERQIRQEFIKVGECPKILIVTEKLGFCYETTILGQHLARGRMVYRSMRPSGHCEPGRN